MTVMKDTRFIEAEALRVAADEVLVLRVDIHTPEVFERWSEALYERAPYLRDRVLLLGPGTEIVGVVKR